MEQLDINLVNNFKGINFNALATNILSQLKQIVFIQNVLIMKIIRRKLRLQIFLYREKSQY